MAMLDFTARSGEIAFTGGTARTGLQLVAGANTPIKVKRIIGSFKGASWAEPGVNVQVVRQTGAGSGGSAVTLVKHNSGDAETLQSSALSGLTAEPASDDAVVHEFKCHPQDGFVLPGNWPDPAAKLRGSGRLGIKINAVTSVTGSLELDCEE